MKGRKGNEEGGLEEGGEETEGSGMGNIYNFKGFPTRYSMQTILYFSLHRNTASALQSRR